MPSKLVIALVVLAVLSSAMCERSHAQQLTPSDRAAAPADAVKTAETLHVGSDDVTVRHGLTTLYIMDSSGGDGPDQFIGQFLCEDGGKLPVAKKYFKVSGNTVEVSYKSSDPKVLSFWDIKNINEVGHFGWGAFSVWKPGKVTVTVTVGDQSVQVPLTIVKMPGQRRTSSEDVVKALGVPDETAKKIVPVYRATLVDGVLYRPTDARYRYALTNEGLPVEHWKYTKYPDAALEMWAAAMGGGDISGDVKLISWEAVTNERDALLHAEQK